MNRLLACEGTNYQKIAQEALRTIVERLIVDADMPLVDISAILDYADANVFTQAFRNWHGCSPSEWRQIHTKQVMSEPS